MVGNNGWQPIETAPKDRAIDIWAKIWLSDFDTFKGQRFPDCRWKTKDAMGAWPEGWSGVDKGWRPTHWQPIPEPPR